MGSLDTNTILAAVPESYSLPIAHKEFSKYGDILHLDWIEGRSPDVSLNPAITASYYDVRAAAWTMKALGGPKHCRPGPMRGNRSVSLRGDFNLSLEDIGGVSSLKDNPTEGGYTVTFFDSRHAEKVRVASEETKEDPDDFALPPGLCPPPGLSQGPPPGLSQGKTSSLFKDVTNVPPPTRPYSDYKCIKIIGLDKNLCSENMFKATLQQWDANLDMTLIHFTTQPGRTAKIAGEAKVWLSSLDAATSCISHFDGRTWGGSKVKAELCNEALPLIPKQRKRCDTSTTVSTNVPSDDEASQ